MSPNISEGWIGHFNVWQATVKERPSETHRKLKYLVVRCDNDSGNDSDCVPKHWSTVKLVIIVGISVQYTEIISSDFISSNMNKEKYISFYVFSFASLIRILFNYIQNIIVKLNNLFKITVIFLISVWHVHISYMI